jgi:hypothetical protein
MLGDHKLIFSTTLNGRLEETSLLGQYANLSKRTAWTVGIQQQPYYGYGSAGTIPGDDPNEGIFIQQYQRVIYRTLFLSAYRPTSRFRRFELGMQAVNAQDDVIEYLQPYDLRTGFPTEEPIQRTRGLGNKTYVMPSLALVFDNSLMGTSVPWAAAPGSRSQSFGSWEFTQGTFDYRRYDKLAGPFTLATRLFYFGRSGRDAEQFQFYAGTPELIRGHTYGSYERNECYYSGDPLAGCAVNNLVGSQVAVGNVESDL